MQAAVDNDILLKGASYGLLTELIQAVPCEIGQIGVLGAVLFVLRNSLRRINLAGNIETIERSLKDFLGQATLVEPTTDEIRFAAELEFNAQRANLTLDSGESQLCSIVLSRALSWLVTGDKRAIAALEQVLTEMHQATGLAGKVLCLEQLFLKLLETNDARDIRGAVCSEPTVDRALAACFSCSSDEVGPESWREGLQSYIADLRRAAITILSA